MRNILLGIDPRRAAVSIFHAAAFAAIILAVATGSSAQVVRQRTVRASFTAGADQSINIGRLELRVQELVNAARLSSGRAPVSWDPRAAQLARSHSMDMVRGNYFGHADLSGTRIDGRAEKIGFNNWRSLGENIAWSQGAADAAAYIVDEWMRSAGHRQNILNQGFTQAGVGIAASPDGRIYFTQVFVKP